jgi:hypothetical protein
MATHTIEIGTKPYIQAEITKSHNGNYLLFCRYSESKETFSFEPNSADFIEWLEEEQIDEATVLLYEQLQEWTDEVDEQDDAEAEREAEDWEQTKKHINDNWSSY